MSISLIPAEFKANQPDEFMSRIRAAETEQKGRCLDSENKQRRKKTKNLRTRSKGLGTFMHSTNWCYALEQVPQCSLGNSSCKGEYNAAKLVLQ